VLTRSRIRVLQRALGRRGYDGSYRVQLYREMAEAIRQSRRLARDIGLEFRRQNKAQIHVLGVAHPAEEC
jgi:hypothetical protein